MCKEWDCCKWESFQVYIVVSISGNAGHKLSTTKFPVFCHVTVITKLFTFMYKYNHYY